MRNFSPSDLYSNAVPFHPSLLIEDESVAGVTGAKRYFARAYENQTKGNFLEALHDYRNAVVLCPTMFEAFFNMGLCYEQSRDAHRAIQAFEQVARLQHEFKPIYRHLSHLYALQGNHEKAHHYERTYRKLQS
jgi:tetratricopeptide (TPR) repeat protein